MEQLLKHPDYISNVFYLEGDFTPYNLRRAQLDKAQAIVILSDVLSPDPTKEDANTIIKVMVITKYL